MVGRADDIMPRVRLTADTEVIDATGKHLYPGLIVAESQLGLTEMGSVLAMHDFNETGAFTPEVRAAIAVNPDSTLIPVARTNGILLFTAVPTGGRIPGRASVMRADGWTSEDMTALDAAALVVNFPNVRRGTPTLRLRLAQGTARPHRQGNPRARRLLRQRRGLRRRPRPRPQPPRRPRLRSHAPAPASLSL
ncbi:MAG: hypothetical protein R3B49_01230 [Phycisphaerales bacterium]